MQQASASYGQGRYRVEGVACACGIDVSASFVGGELSHVGAVSLAVYEPERDSATVSTMTAFGHRDDQLSSRGAKRLSKALRCTAAVSVGIHVDDATEDDVLLLCENFDRCLEQLVQALRNGRSAS